MNKFIVSGIFFVIFIAGLVVILINQSVSFGEFMRSLGRLNPRIMSLLLLPFIAVIFVLGIHLHKKRLDRMWKRALKDTRNRTQQ